MATPPLGYNARNILTSLQEHVAPHILAAIHMDDTTRMDITYHDSLVFQNMSFTFQGAQVQGIIAIYLRATSGRFDVLLQPDRGRSDWASNLTGAKLEDLIIELADI